MRSDKLHRQIFLTGLHTAVIAPHLSEKGYTVSVAKLTRTHLEYIKEQQAQIKKMISDHFDQHPHLKQQRELLTSIPGIGEQTAAVLLAEVGRIEDYKNARQLAAYAGLTPCERSSGTSVHGETRLSCTGNVRLRKALYMPAVVAMRCNPLLKAMTERLLGRGWRQNAGDWCFDEEVGAFGFWYFKVPKAFRSNLFARYPLTDQDSIYSIKKTGRIYINSGSIGIVKSSLQSKITNVATGIDIIHLR